MRQANPSRQWTRRSDERPQELLDAAIEVFATAGYRATRLEQVAEAAGVTKGTIYYYFENKDDLLTKALEARIGGVFRGIQAESERATGSVAERLRVTLRAAWERWLRPETARMQRLITGELRVEFPELYDRAMRAGPMHLWQLVAGVLEDGKARGEVQSTVDADAAARFIVSGLMHQALFQADLRERGLEQVDADRIFEAAFAVVMHGVIRADAAAPEGPRDRVAVAAARRGRKR